MGIKENIRFGTVAAAACLLVLFLGGAPAANAQDPNLCDEPGEAPDVIVGDLHQVNSYGNVGEIYGYSVGTVSCNVGSCWLDWISETNEHPVIAQNMYKLKDGRFTQVGQSWLKHGFFALSQELCSSGCVSGGGSHLGVNCSDPYSASLNGQQGRLGPRSEVNPTTGYFPYPFTSEGQTGDRIYKRLQVHQDDLDPALNAGAQYFVEGQYITHDDAGADRDDNNASYRTINVDPSTYNISLTGATNRGKAALYAWAEFDSGVVTGRASIENDGIYLVGSKSVDLGGGWSRFEFAVQNMNADRAAGAFWMPVPAGATVTNIGFNDAITRLMPKYLQDGQPDRARMIYRATAFLTGSLSIMWYLLLLIFSRAIVDNVAHQPDALGTFRMYTLMIPFLTLNNFFAVAFLVLQRGKLRAKITIFYGALNILIPIAAVLWQRNVTLVAGGFVAAEVIGAAVFAMSFRNSVAPSLGRQIGPLLQGIKEVFTLGITFFFAQLGWNLIHSVDRIMVKVYLPAAQLGFYSMSALFVTTLGMISSTLGVALVPSLSAAQTAGDTETFKKQVRNTSRAGFLALVPIIICTYVLAPDLIKLLVPQFEPNHNHRDPVMRQIIRDRRFRIACHKD